MSIIYKGATVANVSGTYGGGNGVENVNSTEETVIGAWIDGKPLYRKVFTAIVPSFNETAPVGFLSYPETFEVVHYRAKLTRNDGYSTETNWLSTLSGYWYQVYDHRPTHSILVNGGSIASSLYSGTNATIELEYTKTTD